MTKKDFELIADVLNDTQPHAEGLDDGERAQWVQWVIMRNCFADKLVKANPRFDRQRFIAATEK